MRSHWIIIIFIAIGIFLRIYQYNSIPAGLFSDEVSIAVNAKTIAQNGTDEYGRSFPFAFESVSDYKLPGYIYSTALAYTLLGSQLVTVRIVSIAASIISIFLIGYLALLLFPEKKTIKYYAMLALAVCPYHILFGRIAYETMLSTTLLLVYFIALLRILRGYNPLVWFGIGALALVGSISTYPAARFIIPAITVSLCLLSCILKFKDISRKKIMISTVIFLSIVFVSFIPSLLNPLIDKRPLSYITMNTHGTFFSILVQKTSESFTNWLRFWNLEFLFDKGDLFAFRHGTKENGIFLLIFIIPFFVGIVQFIKQFSLKSLPSMFILLLLFICAFPSILTSSTPYGPRFLPMLIPLCLLISIGLEYLISEFQKRQYVKIIGIGIASIILLYQVSLFGHIYFIHYKHNSLPEFSGASTQLGLYIKNITKNHPQQLVYFLIGKSCQAWGHDELHVWYLANMDNKEMIIWNNIFRKARYNVKLLSPFDAYDRIIIPRGRVGNIILYPSYEEMADSKKGSWLVRCGLHLKDIDLQKEKIKKLLYRYDDIQQDVFYVITQKK